MAFYESLFFILFVPLLAYTLNNAYSFYVENSFRASSISDNLDITIPEENSSCTHTELENLSNNSDIFNFYYYYLYVAEMLTHAFTVYVLIISFFVALPVVTQASVISSSQLKTVIVITVLLWFVVWLSRHIAVTRGQNVDVNITDRW